MHILGGLSEEVDEKILHAAFIPFGDVTDINIPLDYETGIVLYSGISYLFVVWGQGPVEFGGKLLNH